MVTTHYRISALISEAAYSDSPPQMIEGWDLIAIKGNTNSGYFGVSYRDKTTGDIIIGSRGTQPTDFRDLQSDLDIALSPLTFRLRKAHSVLPKLISKPLDFLFSKLGCSSYIESQIKSGISFAKEIKANHKLEGELIFTGHSLGGLLAEILATKNQKTFVSFDSPGTFETACNFFNNEKFKVDEKSTTFLTEPNFINTTGTHLTENIIKMDLQKDEQYNSKTLPSDLIGYGKFSLQQHPIANIVKTFDPTTDMPKSYEKVASVSWPKGIKDGYINYLQNKGNNSSNGKKALGDLNSFDIFDLDTYKVIPELLFGNHPVLKLVTKLAWEYMPQIKDKFIPLVEQAILKLQSDKYSLPKFIAPLFPNLSLGLWAIDKIGKSPLLKTIISSTLNVGLWAAEKLYDLITNANPDPISVEYNNPISVEYNNPISVEYNNPISVEYNNPISVEYNNPISVEYNNPISVEYNNPISVEYNNPISVEYNNPISVEYNNPISVEYNNPISVEYNNPISVEYNNPISVEYNNPISVDHYNGSLEDVCQSDYYTNQNTHPIYAY